MQLLSPRYRNDSEDGLDDDIKKYLNKHYILNLKNLRYTNPKLLVVFSGGNAVGKSTLSRLIEDQLKGLVLENDAIKRHIMEYMPGIKRNDLNKLTWKYSMYLYKNLGELTKNGLVVRDGIIDWYYDRVLPVFKKNNYVLFIIGFDLSRDKAVELIKNRGDTKTTSKERLYSLLDEHALHNKRFRSEYTPDITLNDDTIFEHNIVIEKLGERIKQLKT